MELERSGYAPDLVTQDELCEMIREKSKDYVSRAEMAREMMVDPKFLTNVVAGCRFPGTKVLRFMGYEEVTYYRKVK
jgi:hypothetical protein